MFRVLVPVMLAVLPVCADELCAGGQLCASKQSWKGDYYRLQLEKDTGMWTIHGLWPEWGFHCRQVTFDEAKLKPILPQLEEYWPSNKGSNTRFWAHEWEKHGSCAAFTQDELTYFNTTLTLYHSYVRTCGSGTACSVCFTRDGMKHCDCTAHSPGNCV